MSVTTLFLNPPASNSSRYSPTCTASNPKEPSSEEVVERSVAVPTLINFTLAPETTLHWGSLTVPRTVEVPACANAVRAKTPTNKAALRNRASLLKEILVFIESSDAILSADPDLERLVTRSEKR